MAKNLPGWLYMLAVALVATGLSGLFIVGGKTPVEAAVLAILLGMVLRNVGAVPGVCLPGINAFEKILILGIVCIGASLNFHTMLSQGVAILLVVIVTMVIGLVSIYALARLFQLPLRLSILLAVGTTICGGSAIAVTAPLIQAQKEETSYAIGTIALWGLIAIIVYPLLARAMQVDDMTFGIFAGTAIHSTPQVVGAGFIFSEVAGKTATAVKLVRNCFMIPAAFAVSLWYARTHAATSQQPVNIREAFPWFLFGYFIMAGLRTARVIPADGIALFTKAGKFCILLGLAGIGLTTTLQAFRTVGMRPLVVGLIGSVVVALCSLAMIWLTH